MKNFDKKYKKTKAYWGNKPSSLAVNLAKILKKGSSVLDLGCGQGRNAIYLAKKGYKVTAVDVSKIAIDSLKQLAKNEKLPIKAIRSDARIFIKKSVKFDAVLTVNIIQFFDKKIYKELLNNFQKITKKNGINTIEAFINIGNGKSFFDEGELIQYYSKWAIVQYDEKMTGWETHGEKRHRHFIVRLSAMKT